MPSSRVGGGPRRAERAACPRSVAVVMGTRPEIIKMSPIIRALQASGQEFYTVFTGQHHSYDLSRVFFRQLRLPSPEFSLRVGSGTHAEETAKILVGVEKVLTKERPSVVLVEGDTNTVLGGALAAAKLGVPCAHVEAGLRSNDRRMPEEINRVLVDHLADFLFAPTDEARNNLIREGLPDGKIHVVGNTIVDAVKENLVLASETRLNIRAARGPFALLTLHREENVDDPARLKRIVRGVELVSRKTGLPVVYPMHPRTRKRCAQFSISFPTGVFLLFPLDYLRFLKLESTASIVLTDSGGVQEEACILKVPCVTLRDNTERPETVEVGANVVAGTRPDNILRSTETMLRRRRDWPNPFGDGKAAVRIVGTITSGHK
ncbi:MAG: UDP-N-acetylglucosamine 2-epimerase (non-hydrolyzing) [Conexivisphaerales archaeon]